MRLQLLIDRRRYHFEEGLLNEPNLISDIGAWFKNELEFKSFVYKLIKPVFYFVLQNEI
jgi:hypothetical protein